MQVDHLQPYWANVGRLIMAHASVEQEMFVLLLKTANYPFEEGIEVFSNETRIDKCKDAIKKIVRVKRLNIERLEEVFAQITIITKIRNGFCHFKCLSSPDGPILDTGITFGENGVRYLFEEKHFDHINEDLETIHNWIAMYLLAAVGAPVPLPLLFASIAPFQYKPSEPFLQNRRSQQGSPKRKDPSAPSAK